MKRIVVASMAFATLMILNVTPAAASYGSAIWDPDNRAQAVDWWSLNANGQAAATHGAAQLDRSDIMISSGGGDIHVRGYDYPDAWPGSAQCINVDWTQLRCDEYDVRLNERILNNYSLSIWKGVACQEFGHTGSVNHRTAATDTDNNSCMREDASLPNLDNHDLSDINAGF